MKKVLLTALIGLLLATAQGYALEVTALAPVRGTPGTLIAVYGGPFTPQTRLFLGEQYVEPRVILENHIEFTIPELDPGSYALTVQDDTSTAPQNYQFEVLSAAPEITRLEPRILDSCRPDQQSPVKVIGRNFQPGAQLVVNRNVMPSQRVSPTLIEAEFTELELSGVYGVAVRNPDGATSLPHSLWIKDVPEIISVERGESLINSYQVIIHGKNFHFNSTLIVNEPADSGTGQTSQQLSFAALKNNLGQTTSMNETSRLSYVDCQTLIYHRYPSFQDKDLTLQIFNPDGRNTDPYHVTLP